MDPCAQCIMGAQSRWDDHPLFAVGDLGHTMFYLVDYSFTVEYNIWNAPILHLTDHTTCNIDEDIRIRATKVALDCVTSFIGYVLVVSLMSLPS